MKTNTRILDEYNGLNNNGDGTITVTGTFDGTMPLPGTHYRTYSEKEFKKLGFKAEPIEDVFE